MNKKIIFFLVYIFAGFGLMQIPFSQIIGSSLKFSLFDFFGPIIGGLAGSLAGLVTVLAMQVLNWTIHGLAMDVGTLIRFFPMLFAVLYFARRSWLICTVPVLAMVAFWIHPEGRAAWYYALYWLIPVAMYFLADRFLLARALGTTFTAHAVGSILFLYFFNLPSAVWIGLLPIVWKERGLMALGILVSYIAFNFLLSFLQKKLHVSFPFLRLNPKYSLNNH
ncbi:MAG TPA: hypothetical protein VJB37_01795 [Patescibacteria group bacterium]|nr:hypothetical protein [Patescibacteria group bacterium]